MAHGGVRQAPQYCWSNSTCNAVVSLGTQRPSTGADRRAASFIGPRSVCPVPSRDLQGQQRLHHRLYLRLCSVSVRHPHQIGCEPIGLRESFSPPGSAALLKMLRAQLPRLLLGPSALQQPWHQQVWGRLFSHGSTSASAWWNWRDTAPKADAAPDPADLLAGGGQGGCGTRSHAARCKRPQLSLGSIGSSSPRPGAPPPPAALHQAEDMPAGDAVAGEAVVAAPDAATPPPPVPPQLDLLQQVGGLRAPSMGICCMLRGRATATMVGARVRVAAASHTRWSCVRRPAAAMRAALLPLPCLEVLATLSLAPLLPGSTPASS